MSIYTTVECALLEAVEMNVQKAAATGASHGDRASPPAALPSALLTRCCRVLRYRFVLCAGLHFSGDEAEGGAVRGGQGQERGGRWRHDKT